MNAFFMVSAGVALVLLFIIATSLTSISMSLRELRPKLPPAKKPWESDGSNFNVAKPGGDFPDQM
jgi:hypothetical protein